MMQLARSDEDLLAGRDPESFELFYTRHVEGVLGFFARRTRDADLAADLTAETFAAALAGRRRFRPQSGAASAWLFGIAMKKLADAQRRGYAERRACRRLGMERLELTDDDIARIDALGESSTASALWATAGGRLIRIDPATHGVSARIPLGTSPWRYRAVASCGSSRRWS
jgi:DNA-directed RNA polymerase specialized sigma24 family protein